MTLFAHDAFRPVSSPPLNFEPAEESDRRILIIDDEESICDLFAAYLGERYSCATASTAREGLAKLAERTFALVITDVIMPGLSGIELLREIVVRFPDTAVIVVSGVNRTQRVLDAVRLGASDYLIKPCDLDVLGMSVERALERRALLRAARRYKQDLEQQNAELARRKAELERLQGQLVQNEKMASLGGLAAGIAHELNNPAGFIHGNMEFLSEYFGSLERLLVFYNAAPLPAATRAEVERIKNEIDYDSTLDELPLIISDCRSGAERIRNVVQNLRTFSRLDEAEFKKVDINEGIESTVRLLSQFYGAKRVRLYRSFGELPPVDCYAGQLNQVWLNLLVNAAHAMNGREGGVYISTELAGGNVIVRVRDTGCGIRPEHLNKIFDPFFTTKPVGEGTGLGLSITYGIIERHNGSITVESKVGEGTTFIVRIPIDAVARRRDGRGGEQPSSL